ncbi:MAG: DUF839 domain-containing protein [Methylococcaceae bacterium]|nr:DUF839 domain-containing protein [Methylococcaceae bacterium]
MKKVQLTKLATAIGMLLAVNSAFAEDVRFQDFTPLAASAGPTANEALPITLSNPVFIQKSIADRATVLSKGTPNSGNWDMLTVNETGRDKGRYLFTVFETGSAGVQRQDLRTGKTETIWQSPGIAPAANSHVAFDASYWTPWGTFITAEESWEPNPSIEQQTFGRLFELKNPTKAPGIKVGESNSGANFVHQNVIPRTAHEGIQFDAAGNMYFIDELNGGCIYKYTSAANMLDVKRGKADYFAAGTTYVLRVGDGLTPNATGAYEWVAITDATGAALPGAVTITDLNGITSVDATTTTDTAEFKGTDYQRPEDLQIQNVRGKQYLYVATTTTAEVYRLDLSSKKISVFANQSSTDLASGAAVGTALRSPDNLAVDKSGNIYVVEDRAGGSDDDIWFAKDRNKDGDLTDLGEGLGRWASNGTVGSEFSGLYFDPFNKRRAWVNIQHPASANDRTIEITIPDDDSF